MDDVRLVEAVLDLTGLRLRDGTGDIRRNRTGLRVRHEAARAKHLTEAADHTHHVRGGDDDVKIHPAFGLDLLDHVVAADILGAGIAGFLFLLRLADCEHADGLTRAVRQNNRAADLLVRMTAVNAQLYMDFNGLVELCCTCLYAELKRFFRIIKTAALDQLCAFDILFTVFHSSSS